MCDGACFAVFAFKMPIGGVFIINGRSNQHVRIQVPISKYAVLCYGVTKKLRELAVVVTVLCAPVGLKLFVSAQNTDLHRFHQQ